jgi:cystathionine beta-lyase/cystathionine gamma-synthase
MKFETNAIHAAQEADKETGAVIPPIHMSSTFKQESVGKHKGFEYSRTGNPTRNKLEELIANLENGKFGLGFASGSSATTTIQLMLNKGDHVICGDDVYGGTFRFFDKVMKNFGIEYSFVDTRNPDNVKNAIQPNTKMLWLETPTNPLLKISDLQAISEIGLASDLMTIVDNTFASPYIQNPLNLGADIVLHSSTKYIGGHSDLVGGLVITSNEEIHEKLRFLQNAAGAVPSPFDCWLAMRGIKTLSVRVREHSKNAEKIVGYLSQNNHVDKIYYPFLETHENYDIARKQMKLGGGMISFDLKAGKDSAYNFLKQLKIFTLAESLGGVESLCEYPADMTHGSIPESEREKIGIKPGLIRLSVGIEHVDDLILDLENGFKVL